jgi:hypothetical protein
MLMTRYQTVKRNIRNTAKYPIAVTFMSGDGWYRCIEDDAELMHSLFGCNYNPSWYGYKEVSIKPKYIFNWIDRLKSADITYAFATICDRNMTRKVTRSSDVSLIGKKFH